MIKKYLILFIIVYLIFYPFLLFFLISKRKFYGYFTSKAWPIFLLTLPLILLVSSPSLNIDFKKFQMYMIAYLVLIWGVDSAGYFIGLKFGKKKLYESVSPKKTIDICLNKKKFYSFCKLNQINTPS